MYELTQNPFIILRVSDQAHIPMSEGNRDYEEFAAWVRAGNQPAPALDLTPPVPEQATPAE